MSRPREHSSCDRIVNLVLALIITFLLTIVEGVRLWVVWDQGRLKLPLYLMPAINLFLGPTLFVGIWRQSRFAFGLVTASLVGNAVNLFLVGEIPSDPPTRGLLKLALCLSTAWHVWRIRPKSKAEVCRDFIRMLREGAARLDAQRVFPRGRMTILLKLQMVPIDFGWLQGCVSRATGRECRLDDTIYNIDMCAERARLRDDESFAGGAGKLAVIAVKNINMQMHSSSSPTSSLKGESTPRGRLMFHNLVAYGIDRDGARGLNWLVPIAIAMWSNQVLQVSIEDGEGNETEFVSRDDLIRYAVSHKYDGFGTLATLSG